MIPEPVCSVSARRPCRRFAIGRYRPQATKLHRLEENLGAVRVELTADHLREMAEAAASIEVQGARLPEAVLKFSYK